jgi:hypothetical protein
MELHHLTAIASIISMGKYHKQFLSGKSVCLSKSFSSIFHIRNLVCFFVCFCWYWCLNSWLGRHSTAWLIPPAHLVCSLPTLFSFFTELWNPLLQETTWAGLYWQPCFCCCCCLVFVFCHSLRRYTSLVHGPLKWQWIPVRKMLIRVFK